MSSVKYLIILLATTILFISCNNRSTATDSTSTDSLAVENQMRNAIATYPDSIPLKEKLIQFYRENGEYHIAISYTDNAIKNDSNNAKLWKIKGTLHFENEDTANAISSFEKAVDILPGPEYITNLGTLYAETKNARALEMVSLLLRFKKESLVRDALFVKGLYYNYTGDKTKAISNMDSCLALDYTYTLAYREKTIALYDLGKYDAALSVIDKALTVQNNFDEGYYWRGRCLEKLNRNDEAIEAYQTASLYSPDYVEAKEALERLGVKDN